MQRLGILLSGRGSNFLAIADAIASGTLRGQTLPNIRSFDVRLQSLHRAESREQRSPWVAKWQQTRRGFSPCGIFRPKPGSVLFFRPDSVSH